jgi:hypothetical protein
MCFFLLFAGAFMPVWLSAFLEVMKSATKIQVILQRIGWKIPFMTGVFLIFFWSVKIIQREPLSLKLPSEPNPDNIFAVYYPLGAVNYIKENTLSGSILTEFSWGEYLMWDLYPQCLVSLDGRYEQVYLENISREYFDFLFARAGWKQFLEKYPPDMILLPSRLKIHSLVYADQRWQKVYADKGSVLFVKRTQISK